MLPVVLTVCDRMSDYLSVTLPFMRRACDERVIVVTDVHDSSTQELCAESGTQVLTADLHENGRPFWKARAVNLGIAEIVRAFGSSWVCLADCDVILPEYLTTELKASRLPDPGHLWWTCRLEVAEEDVPALALQARTESSFDCLADRYSSRVSGKDRLGNDPNAYPYGYFQLFYTGAPQLAGNNGKYYDEGCPSAADCDLRFSTKFSSDAFRQVSFPVLHLGHGPRGGNWSGRTSAPLREGRSVAMVAASRHLPLELVRRWTDRNRQLCRAEDTLVLVTDAVSEISLDLVTLRSSQTDVYSPAVEVNRGIRYAVDAGYSVVIKTDIDCILSHWLMAEARCMSFKECFFPYYMMTAEDTEEAMSRAKAWPNGMGTAVLTSSWWKKLCGYDERMSGYGVEDGDLWVRAVKAGLRPVRHRNFVWHINHPPRCTGPSGWYPDRHTANLALHRQDKGPWNNALWGVRQTMSGSFANWAEKSGRES